MSLVQNFPFFNIIMCLAGGVTCSVLRGKYARRLTMGLLTVILCMSAFVLAFVFRTGESYTFMMGHFPAPWGNEIRVGILEALMAVFFSLIMILSILGGGKYILSDIIETKQNLFYVLINLMMSSLLALIYTNDLFTAYVFIEINTIAAGGLILIRDTGHTLVAATKYMIMSLIGSGLILIGLSMLYGITGHLLMSNIHESVIQINANGQYTIPLTVIIVFICVGLAIKSALFPFHSWLPDAYSYGTAASSAILSSLVSKSYIFLLIKIFYRVIGLDIIMHYHVENILFVFAILGMILGSVSAIHQMDIRRMIAFSSVAQIGYIYMGIGLDTEAGILAALFHVISHAASKSLLFISARGLSEVSGNSKLFPDLKGAGYRNIIAGIGFSTGALSMIGIPLFAGFTSKVYFALATLESSPFKLWTAMIALAISTVLNAVYFLHTVLTIYTPVNMTDRIGFRAKRQFTLAVLLFVLLNLFLGIGSNLVWQTIQLGTDMFM
ncbi:MAG: sodium:proton antiporter [Eubacterium sp.]|jgi:multicomponent Na+:H+ antiporter subunit D|nr:sodium:proton antiporter [Eubacterium sp.]